MLSWVGKRPLREVRAFPAQAVERFAADGSVNPEVDWSGWPDRYERGGLLFHGDNKEVLAHLLANGFRGKVDLVYIDPPFDSGADYIRRVQLRGASGSARLDGETYTLGEQIQYTDIWANDTYLQFMYERLLLLKELLAANGSLFVHCGPGRGPYLRAILDEVLGPESQANEIVWCYTGPSSPGMRAFADKHDTIYWYARGSTWTFNVDAVRLPYAESTQRNEGRRTGFTTGNPDLVVELNPLGKFPEDWWEIPVEAPASSVRTDYPTQKPERLLERVIKAASNPGDIVLDCFIGSGTTAAVAQKLGRRWIGADINKVQSRPRSSVWRG